jgi:hypothetical protein
MSSFNEDKTSDRLQRFPYDNFFKNVKFSLKQCLTFSE